MKSQTTMLTIDGLATLGGRITNDGCRAGHKMICVYHIRGMRGGYPVGNTSEINHEQRRNLFMICKPPVHTTHINISHSVYCLLYKLVELFENTGGQRRMKHKNPTQFKIPMCRVSLKTDERYKEVAPVTKNGGKDRRYTFHPVSVRREKYKPVQITTSGDHVKSVDEKL